jgi:hypothetical protein
MEYSAGPEKNPVGTYRFSVVKFWLNNFLIEVFYML